MMRQATAKTLKSLCAQAHLVIGLDALSGLPVGGWGETQQAITQIEATLPLRQCREYTVDEAIAALYVVQGDRYRWRATHERDGDY